MVRPVRSPRCSLCGADLCDPAAHVPTPELRGRGDSAVYYCLEAQRHVSVPIPFVQDVARLARELARKTRP